MARNHTRNYTSLTDTTPRRRPPSVITSTRCIAIKTATWIATRDILVASTHPTPAAAGGPQRRATIKQLSY